MNNATFEIFVAIEYELRTQAHTSPNLDRYNRKVPVRYRPNAARLTVKHYMCACATSACKSALLHSSGRGLAVHCRVLQHGV